MKLNISASNGTSVDPVAYGRALLSNDTWRVSSSGSWSASTGASSDSSIPDVAERDRQLRDVVEWIEAESGPFSQEIKDEVASFDWPA